MGQPHHEKWHSKTFFTLTELISKECELVDRVSQFTCVTDDSFVQLALHKVALHNVM